MPVRDRVAAPEARVLRHLPEEALGPVLGPVQGVQGRDAVHERDPGAASVAAQRPQVDPERESGENLARRLAHARLRPLEGDAAQVLLLRILVPAAAVIAVPRHRRVVVAGHAGHRPAVQKLDDFVRPGSVAHEVAEVVDAVGPLRLDLGPRRLQGGQVPVDVAQERDPHLSLPPREPPIAASISPSVSTRLDFLARSNTMRQSDSSSGSYPCSESQHFTLESPER